MTPSLIAIVSHTPTWVWALFAGLVLLGLRQTRTQDVTPARVWLLPAILGAASFAGAVHGFAGAGELLTGAAWGIGALLGALANRPLNLPRQVSANADGSFRIGGSVAPLLLLMGVFMIRYAVNAALAVQPSLSASPTAAVVAELAYGSTAGLFLARSRRIWAARQAPVGPAAA